LVRSSAGLATAGLGREREAGTYQGLVEDYFPNMPLSFYEEAGADNMLVLSYARHRIRIYCYTVAM
jgi:hypothetical protein